MEAMWNGRRIERTAIATHPLLAKARDASAQLKHVVSESSDPQGTIMEFLLDRFLETTMKNLVSYRVRTRS